MSTISLVARGAADPLTVWERYADTRAWSSWSPQITGVELDGPGHRIAPGRRGRVRAVGGVRIPFVITAVDPAAMTWSWRVRLGPVTVRLVHDVRASDDGTRTTLDLDGFLPVVAAYAPLAQVALRRLVRP